MSFHRVLPRLPALSNEDLANRWAIGPDSLRSARIMPDERSNTAFINNGQIEASSSPEPASRKPSTQIEEHQSFELEELGGQSPGFGHQASIPSPVHKPAPSNIDIWQGESPSQLCLCQPDPKVPRPRNAFILYRQHHQADVVQRNPRLANPEISKVIGEEWRKAPFEVKEHWKLLAEEEKLRHQKQYPDYRYQPRRSGRTNSLQDSSQTPHSSVSAEAHRCAKCGGKSIGSSSMMISSPSMSAQGSPSAPNPQGRDGSHTAMPPPHNIASSRFDRVPGSPPVRDGPQQGYRFSRGQITHALPLSSPRYPKRPVDNSETSPNSPDPKRRRVTNVSFAQTRGPNGPQTPFIFSQAQQRRPSLPRPDFMGGVLPSPGAMGPPGRPGTALAQQRADSLKLPPLHTSHGNGHKHTRSGSNDTQAKSLEAMIHSIPVLNKIRVLGRISAPLPFTPTPTSPIGFERRKGRGIVIAVHATDIVAANQLTETLERALKTEYDLKVFPTPHLPEGESASYQSYLRLVDKYHTVSQEVIAHVAPSGGPSIMALDILADAEHTMGGPSQDDGGQEEGEEFQEEESPVSPKSFPKPRTSRAKSKSISLPPTPTAGTETRKLPIALLPSWQLTHTNAFAIAVPITDAYSPMDHWQWHATLWRGTIGADATVAVASASEDQGTSPPGTANSGSSGAGGSASSGGGGGSGPGSGSAETVAGVKARPGTVAGKEKGAAGAGVDIRLEDSRAVIVQGGEKGVSEGALRRVGFEIGEWVRSWGEKDGI